MNLRSAIEKALAEGVTQDEVEALLIQERAAARIAASHAMAKVYERLGSTGIGKPVGEVSKTLKKTYEARHKSAALMSQRVANSVGRWERGEKRTRPYLVYRTMRDRRVRSEHAKWEGLVLPRNSKFWNAHYPPNGWGCRCVATQATEEQVKAMGLKISKKAPKVETETVKHPRTGELMEKPVDVDFAWSFHIGREGSSTLMRAYREALRQLADTADKATARVKAGLLGAANRRLREEPEALAAMAETVSDEPVPCCFIGNVLCTFTQIGLPVRQLQEELRTVNNIPTKVVIDSLIYSVNGSGVISRSG